MHLARLEERGGGVEQVEPRERRGLGRGRGRARVRVRVTGRWYLRVEHLVELHGRHAWGRGDDVLQQPEDGRVGRAHARLVR